MPENRKLPERNEKEHLLVLYPAKKTMKRKPLRH